MAQARSPVPARRALECDLARIESGRSLVSLEGPDLAVSEIVREIPIFAWANFAGPHDLRIVDIRVVIDPFVVRTVTSGVSHHNQVLASLLGQTVDDLFANKVASSKIEGEYPSRRDADAKHDSASNERCETNYDGSPDEVRLQFWLARRATAQRPHSVQNKGANQTCHWRGIMLEKVNGKNYPEKRNVESDEQ